MRITEDQQNQNEDDAEEPKLPTLDQFKSFLERYSRILVHTKGQNRNELDKGQHRSRSRDQSANRHRTGASTGAISKGMASKSENDSRYNQGSNQRRPTNKLPLCRLCGADHGLFSCQIFRDMPFDEKIDLVNKHWLCKVCFHIHDQGDCHINQHPCKKCNNRQTHNTLICPSREAEKRTAMLSVVGNNPNPITFGKAGQKRSHGENTQSE